MNANVPVYARLRRAGGWLYRQLRDAHDAAMHARRHRALLARLSRRPRPHRILVVCYGNICRSPYLEAMLRRELPDIIVSSAGFVGAGRGVPAHSLTLAGRQGLDLASHRSQLLSRDTVRDADVVIVMDAGQARTIERGYRVRPDAIVVAGDLDPNPIERRAILDPWGMAFEMFELSFQRLERCAQVLARHYRGLA
jgi:protein-tyrosine phosphatase